MIGIKDYGEAARLQEKYEETEMIDYDYWEEIEPDDLSFEFDEMIDETHRPIEIAGVIINASEVLKDCRYKLYKRLLVEWAHNQVDGVFLKHDSNGELLRKI